MNLISLLRRKLIYSIAKDHLGVDSSPADLVDDIVGCAESVTNILKKAVGTPIMVGTWTLEQYLLASPNWYEVIEPQAGDVLISATGTSSRGKKAPYRGHTGIIGEKGMIMSNDSYKGVWLANYTLETWRMRYVDNAGYKMRFFRYKV